MCTLPLLIWHDVDVDLPVSCVQVVMAAVRRDVFSLQAAAEELFGTQTAHVSKWNLTLNQTLQVNKVQERHNNRVSSNKSFSQNILNSADAMDVQFV